MKSYSPLYFQDHMWVADNKNGTRLMEWEPSGQEHMWREINHSQLKRLHLVSEESDDCFDKDTGFFVVDGKTYIFPLAGFPLDFKVIQFKNAHTDVVFGLPESPQSKYAGFHLDSYNIGWETQKDDIKVKVILCLHADTKIKEFFFEMTFIDIKRKFSYSLRVA